jgi:hypothetical protein
MSKSYRKPYSAVTGVRSAHHDKTLAARSVRRAQDGAIRNAIASQIDWDEFLLPEVYECSDNDVWSWGRDGNQYLQKRSKEYNNPYAYFYASYLDHDELMVRWEERKAWDDEYLARLVRK